MPLSHLNAAGDAHMVDVGEKPVSARTARATGLVRMAQSTLALVQAGGSKKGDVLAVARVAAIMAAKKTHELIPLCHAIPLETIEITFTYPNDQTIAIEALARTAAKTGVEMEALTAVAVAGLTLYDMLKSVDRSMELSAVRLEEKTGGVHGDYRRDN